MVCGARVVCRLGVWRCGAPVVACGGVCLAWRVEGGGGTPSARRPYTFLPLHGGEGGGLVRCGRGTVLCLLWYPYGVGCVAVHLVWRVATLCGVWRAQEGNRRAGGTRHGLLPPWGVEGMLPAFVDDSVCGSGRWCGVVSGGDGRWGRAGNGGAGGVVVRWVGEWVGS